MLRHKSGRFIFRAKGQSVTKFLGVVGILSLLVWWLASGDSGTSVAREFRTMRENRAKDAVAIYASAKTAGDHKQMCEKAGLAASAFADANDQENYLRWKATAAADCSLAKIPK